MTEWHVTPDYIVNNWTDELLNLMVEKLLERKKREVQAMNDPSGAGHEPEVSDEVFFARAKNLIKVVKK